MQKQGFKKVYQLHGGIIKYLEKTLLEEGDNHWRGDCVVFDKRKAINKSLKPTDKEICYVCLSELHKENKSPNEYPGGMACLTCADKMDAHQENRNKRGLAQHQENLKKRAAFLASERKKYAGSELSTNS